MPSLALLRRSVDETHFDVARDDSDNGSDTVINALLIVLGIAFFILILVSILLVLRRVRRKRQQQNPETQEPILPSYNDVKNGHPNHRGLTIETTHNGRHSVLFISRDGQPMLRTPGSPPHSPDNVPEIHITFPDEQDEQGRRKSGRVVVVRVGENATVGLEPMHDEELPAYEKEAKGQFYSVDMDKIGGLKEKDHSYFDHY
ncbi:uncharacterized protein TRIVIDRAFT_196387 [Trichoderma virens Gv29-8]|uniref:Uncharacterized protein n=1 Tax=Hypocrea virens (strain Gv29-8 / FGSC 10586) TaxID=413071 RepID=G9NCY3_HYPVG|nr:uncharacterized protein TRIVIDRAFT_196387 [Trichoderma virens Gv29-8]EHK15553.1 hypothetical protein TRIVIDRAFT_196387 [Trichoderma virens Gv29-8]